jgi:hypothetical protein
MLDHHLNETEIAGMAIELAAILTSKELKDARALFMTSAAEGYLIGKPVAPPAIATPRLEY